MKKATIFDIAKEAKVSYSTVSRALRESNLVNEDTKKIIKETAKKLNYIPNFYAGYLKTKKSK